MLAEDQSLIRLRFELRQDLLQSAIAPILEMLGREVCHGMRAEFGLVADRGATRAPGRLSVTSMRCRSSTCRNVARSAGVRSAKTASSISRICKERVIS
jgi:hypothetical protein